jgi:hypothetical protein
MNTTTRTTVQTTLAALLFATAVAANAQHAEKCEAIPKTEWKPQAELEKKLTDQGWKVSRVKIENGCYEVYGRDEKNAKVEKFFHPKTLEIVTAPK